MNCEEVGENQAFASVSDEDFESKRISEEIDVDVIRERVKEKKGIQYGLFINFLNRFGIKGGFDAILDIVDPQRLQLIRYSYLHPLQYLILAASLIIIFLSISLLTY